MKIDTLRRHLREAYRGIIKNSWMSFASIGTVAVTLLIFGIFVILALNIGYLTNKINQELSMRVMLADGKVKEGQELAAQLKKDARRVKDARFVSKEQGFEEFKKYWSDTDWAEQVKGSGFPDMVQVQPAEGKIEEIQEVLEKNPIVLKVDTGGAVVDTFTSFSGVATQVLLAFGLGLAILASFLISNTIKLTIIARRKEIEVMRLVGAGNWFIRWPFFFEGAFIGIVGSIFPVGILLILYQALAKSLTEGSQLSLIKIMPVFDLGLYLTISIFCLGAFIGISGSIMSVRRFLKI